MSKYITVLEIDAPLERRKFINVEPGIWIANMTPGLGVFVDPNGLVCYFGDRSNQRKKVESVRVDGVDYTEQLSYADMVASTQSFYWDEPNQYLYIHFTSSNPPASFERIRIGSALGYSSDIDTIKDNTYSDIYYPVRLKNIPNFSKNRDSLFYGILSYGGGTVQLSNEDGELDTFSALDLFGQPARIYQIEEGGTLDEDSQLFEGIMGKVSNDFNTLSIEIRDRRDSFAKSIPTDTIANFDDADDGQVLPIAYGFVRNAPAYRTAATTWVFCDDTYNSVINDASFQVYEDGTAVVHGGTVTDGTFTYNATDPRLVTVDFTVGSFTTGLDILEDVFENYLAISYNSSNYNTNEWSNAKGNAFESAVYLNEATSIRDVIEQITNDNQGILDIQADNRITFRIIDTGKQPVKQIQNFEDGEQWSEVSEDGVKVSYDPGEVLSSVQIGYDQNRAAGNYRINTDTSYQTEVLARYNEARNKRFDTGLVNSADADSLGDNIMARSKQIEPMIQFTTFNQNFDLEIADFILFNLGRIDGSSLGNDTYEVIGFTKRIMDLEMDIIGRFVTGATGVLPVQLQTSDLIAVETSDGEQVQA